MHRVSQHMGAILLAGVYALSGLLWIFYSDQYFAKLADDAYELTNYQTYKGWGYIAVTTLIVYCLIRLAQIHQTRLQDKSKSIDAIQDTLSEASRVIIKTRDMAELFQELCQIAIDKGGYQLAWIGRTDEARQRIDIVATAGGDASLARKLELELNPVNSPPSPIIAALLQGCLFRCDDFKKESCDVDWRKSAIDLGYRSLLALPVNVSGELRAALTLYSSKPHAFDDVETQFLETMATDLGMAISHAEDEQRWILALEGAGHGVWDANLQTRKTFYSRLWKENLGYADHEIGNDMTEWVSRIHPDDLSACLGKVEKLETKQSKTFQGEYRLRCKDGTYRWIRAQGTVFSYTSDGRPARVVGTDTDITDAKSRERIFFEAQKVARVGSYTYDARNDLWTSTDILDEIFGIDQNYLRGAEGWLSIVRPDQRESMRAYLHDVLHRHQIFDRDYPIIRMGDGVERWVHGLGEVEVDEQGAPLRMLGTIQDITERRKNNLMLRGRLELSQLAQQGKVEELLRATLDMAEDLTGSKIGFFHFVNEDHENLTLQAWSSNTLAHMCKAEGQGAHYPVSQAGVWADCVKTKAPIIHNDYASLPNKRGMPEGHAKVERELTVPVVRQGRVVAIAGVGNKLTDYSQSDAAIVQEMAGFVMDLVSNIEAEKSLRQSEAQLRKTTENLQAAVDNLTQLNTELERFAFIASHDLQEPLRNITTYTQLIDRKYRDKIGPEGKEYFDLVVGGAKRMYALINDLLTYSRTAVTTHPPHLISSAQACRAAIENLYSAIKECAADLEIGDLPSVVADEVQMMQLFQNLIANAIKFRHPSRTVKISVAAKQTDEFLEFSVADNGIGFNPEEQDVFELFRRVHANRGYPGTGVGLAICKRIVLRNGGRIWAESQLGKGSVFRFTLPLTQNTGLSVPKSVSEATV